MSILTTKELAVRLRVSQETLRQWRHKGRGPKFFNLEGGHPRYLESDVEEWLRLQSKEEQHVP